MLDRSMASITAPVDFYVQDRPCLHLNMSVLQISTRNADSRALYQRRWMHMNI